MDVTPRELRDLDIKEKKFGGYDPNEVDDLRWLRVDEAVALLSYGHDRGVVRRLQAPPATGETVTIDAANGPLTLETMPTKIVSLSPTATEMLFAVGVAF